MGRRGIVWIAPTDSVPRGCMADPATSTFWVSWQHREDGLLGDEDVVGADAAIAWGRERAQVVRIRLGHTRDTYFSAGVRRVRSLPQWPPQQAPPDGWWSPGDPRDDPPWPGPLGGSYPQINEASSDES